MARATWEEWLEQYEGDEGQNDLRRRYRSLYVDMFDVLRERYGPKQFLYQLAAYVVWWHQPRALRVPRFAAELAQLLGMRDDDNFRKWRRQYADLFAAEGQQRVVLALVGEYLPDVMWASVRSAIDDGAQGFQDRKMQLEMAGLYKPTQRQEISGSVGMERLSDDELERIASRGGQ